MDNIPLPGECQLPPNSIKKDNKEKMKFTFRGIQIDADNSKRHLNEYLQKYGIPAAQYNYTTIVNKSTLTFSATSKVTINGKEYEGSGKGITKKAASNVCSLYLLKQMVPADEYNQTVCESDLKCNESVKEVCVIKTDQKLKADMESYLKLKNIKLPEIPKYEANKEISLMSRISLNKFRQDRFRGCTISDWRPPFEGYDCWRASPLLNNSPFADRSMETINISIGAAESHKIPKAYIENVRKSLPVYKHYQEIVNKSLHNQILLIKSATGSGKSTQVAQFLLAHYINEGRGGEFNCYVTQPRRISAISLAERVAKERYENVGESIGYAVRFNFCLPRPYGAVCFCTVGALLKRLERGLNGISHVIIDEIHERDMSTDFLLIVFKEICVKFPQLRIILMSATVDTSLFSNYFPNLEVLSISEVGFNVEYYYLQDIVQALKYFTPTYELPKINKDPSFWEWSNKNADTGLTPLSKIITEKILEVDDIPYDIIKAIIEECAQKSGDGSVLVFLPGWVEIQFLIKYLKEAPRKKGGLGYYMVPLHSQLPIEEQRVVFQAPPKNHMKIIISTNIAESSITVPDVIYVIDSCRVRKKLLMERSDVAEFVQMWTSKACILQRRGRAGRVRDGFCFHLCTKEQYETLPDYSMPEILCSPLHTMILYIKMLGFGDSATFIGKALEPPERNDVLEDENYLQALCALDEYKELTSLGTKLANLPINPRMGKALLMAAIFDLICPMSMIAASEELQKETFNILPDIAPIRDAIDRLCGDWSSDHLLPLFIHEYLLKNSSNSMTMLVSCQNLNINSSTRSSTLELYRQLTNILRSKCSIPFADQIVGIDNKKDNAKLHVLVSLVLSAYYPNVAYIEKRRSYLNINKSKMVPNKASVTVLKSENNTSKFCVFTEHVISLFNSCKTISVISPLQILLFGCNDVIVVGENEILVDNFFRIQMEPKFAQLILAMRPCVNELLINVCEQPDTLRTCDFNRFCVKNIVERISSLYYRSNEVNDVNKIMRHQTAISFPDVEEILERNDFVNGDFVPDLEASKVQVSESSKVGAHSLQYLKSCDVDLSIFQFDFETIEKESGSKEMVERDVGLKVFSEKGNEVAEKDIEIMETTDEIVKKSCNIPENSGEIIEKINESATECGDVAEKGSVEEKCETVAISTGPAKITEMSQSIYAGFVPIARKNNSTDDSLGSNKHAKLQGKQLLNIQSLNHHINMHEAPNHCDNIDKKFQEPFQRERNVILNDTEDIIGKPVAGFSLDSRVFVKLFKMLSRSVPYLRRLASQSSTAGTALVQKEDTKDNKSISKKYVKAQVEKKEWSLFGDRAFVPTNLSYPNEKGEPGYDPDMPLKEILKDSPTIMKDELKKFMNEVNDSIQIEKIEAIEDTGILRHGDTKVQYKFKGEEDMDIWRTGCDADWGKGFSSGSLILTENNTGLFSGNIDTTVMKDGVVERAGWASMKTQDKSSFNRKKYMTRWWNYSHLIVRCRGDGRSYKLMLHVPGSIDLTWGDSYSYPLHTHGGPYWQVEKIPFSRFFHTVSGRIQDKQHRMNQQNISSLGIVLMDRMDGPFKLEIDFIGVSHDKSHVETFAYETYTLPLFNTDGF
uniref:RNA helicase n=1 Tax=Rhabditophanes sp. KR3021 TaxID=114890 RepID=A0AC35UA59_9BILA